MAKEKMTLKDNFEVVKAMLAGTYKGEVTKEQAIAFIDNRMEQVAKKNSTKSGEPTKAQKEKMAEYTAIENEVLSVMVADTKYTVSDLVKLTSVESTQRLTPRLTALVENCKVAKTEDKGRSYYSRVVVSDEGEGE